MDKKLEFNTALAGLIETAAANSNSLTTEQIENTFEGILDKDMLEHVYEYLVENKVTIKGYIAPVKLAEEDTTSNTEDVEYKESATEQSYINMYLSELDDIMLLSPEEELALITLAKQGDIKSKDKLVEINLKRVINVVDEYKGKGIPTSDLIQEGNLGLIEGIATYNGEESLTEFHNHLIKYINTAIQSVIDEEIDAGRIGKHLADRANALDRFSTEFAKENGREATLEELAFGMGLPEEEIRNILKYSLDALNSTGDE